MPRKDIIDNGNIKDGDVIVGLASYGQAVYESEYNGGMGSNGLTSARHDVFCREVLEKYPETCDPSVPDDLKYAGSRRLTDKVEDSVLDAGKLVLSPTRTYAPVIAKMLKTLRYKIDGMIHCSGGAQTKILHFLSEDLHVTKDNLFPVPPLFKMIHDESSTDWKEMYKVFNMGHRMEIYLPKEYANEVIEISESFGIPARIVGRVEKRTPGESRLTIKSEFGTFDYLS
jgi:phosphoribosylformylglycinamidine cyclo-ligase